MFSYPFPRQVMLSFETAKDKNWLESVYEVIVMNKLLYLWEEELFIISHLICKSDFCSSSSYITSK